MSESKFIITGDSKEVCRRCVGAGTETVKDMCKACPIRSAVSISDDDMLHWAKKIITDEVENGRLREFSVKRHTSHTYRPHTKGNL